MYAKLVHRKLRARVGVDEAVALYRVLEMNEIDFQEAKDIEEIDLFVFYFSNHFQTSAGGGCIQRDHSRSVFR